MTMAMIAVAAAVMRPWALALLLLAPLASSATSSPASAAAARGLGEPRRRLPDGGAAFLLLPPRRARRRAATRKAAHRAPDPSSRDEATHPAGAGVPSCYSYVPPYGTVPRSSAIVLNMSPARGGSAGGGDVLDDRFRKKMNSRRGKDPVVQDFGDATDWQRSKTGLGRMGDDKAGDDGLSEAFGVGNPGQMYDDEGLDLFDRPPGVMDRRPPLRVRENGGEMTFEGEGGNYWVNPPNSMDRYPRRNGSDGMMARRGRRGRGRGRNRRRRDFNEDDRDWWETRRREEDLGDFDEDFDYEYRVPPPTRSRSSFRSGAPPPPRPVKEFYDRLFWFGFDSDVTRPTDRTMFGGTRGKFNAMDMLQDREERQRRRGGEYDGRSRSGPTNRGRRRDSVIQDFGSVDDWDARKSGRGRAGGADVGDDRDRPNYGYESALEDAGPGPFPGDADPSSPLPRTQEFDRDARYGEDFDLDDGFDFEGGRQSARRRDRSGRRRRRNDRRGDMDGRAEEYDRLLAGVGVDEYATDEDYPPAPSLRRRRGFAYKYNNSALLDYDDGEFIEVEPKPKYAAERDSVRVGVVEASALPPGRRRRSLVERAIESDRVPPRGAVAWGPDGKAGGDPLDRAAREALEDIRKSKMNLERKEKKVEEATEEVVNLKADASFYQNQLEEAQGLEVEELGQELGYILQDIEDASRNLRIARAEMDDASNRVRDLEERNWALLSEYEAGRSFEEGK